MRTRIPVAVSSLVAVVVPLGVAFLVSDAGSLSLPPAARAAPPMAPTAGSASAVPAPARPPAKGPGAGFFLRDGDRVVFYGDSITEQRLYTTFVESYVVTRFPKLDVSFVHSGWGGDRVTGGSGGEIHVRLQRDVFAHRPTVVTVMLGMNDGRYKAADKEAQAVFMAGYDALVRALRLELPDARLTLIQPSPYDEVTRAPMKGGGYNPVLLKYGAFVRKIAARERQVFADLNTDLVQVLQKAYATDPADAAKIVKDRVHPGPAGHLIMAGSLLTAWKAPALVTEVVIEGRTGKLVRAIGTAVKDLKRAGTSLTWQQEDEALPMPLDRSDAVIALALRSSRFMANLDRQPLQVMGLAPGNYTLSIDDDEVGTFPHDALYRGVNLAELATPMNKQAAEVHALTLKRVGLYHTRWRSLQLPLEKEELESLAPALGALDRVVDEVRVKQRSAAQPVPHSYRLVAE